MAYEVPERWSHGDYPIATKINKYKNGLDAIHAIMGDVQIALPVARRIAPVQGFYFIHKHRFLIYFGSGRIEDPAGVNDAITLSNSGITAAVYDLAQVEWMYPGKLYQVQGVNYCFEDVEA